MGDKASSVPKSLRYSSQICKERGMSFWVLSCEYTYRFFALLWAVVEPLSSMLSIDKPHNGTCGTILLYTVRIASKLKYRADTGLQSS